jgi:hypothetical protein
MSFPFAADRPTARAPRERRPLRERFHRAVGPGQLAGVRLGDWLRLLWDNALDVSWRRADPADRRGRAAGAVRGRFSLGAEAEPNSPRAEVS